MASSRRWTQEEINSLRELWKTKTPAHEIAARLGRPRQAIYNKAYRLNLPHKDDPKTVRLSREDKLWLKLNFPHMRTELCAAHLGMSVRTCIRKARELGIDKSSQFMAESQAFSTKRAWASNSKRLKGKYTPNLQKGKAYQFDGSNRKWTEDLDRKVIELYPTHSASSIAKMLGFSRASVCNRCHILGLSKRTKPK